MISLKQLKNSYNNLLPDELPDKSLCGTHISACNNSNHIYISTDQFINKIIINIKRNLVSFIVNNFK
jgi:hypothetical protein